jgi:hypothetical protein
MSDILEGLRVASATLSAPEALDQRRFGDGSVIQSTVGAALWQGSVTLAPAPHAVARAAEARIAAAARAGQSILIGDPRIVGPAADPAGATLGAASVTIHAIGANGATIRLAGLPAGYVLSAGDLLSFSYGTNPVRRALHQFSAAVTATGAGLTAHTAIVPPIRPGAGVGAAVTLVRPQCRALITDWRPGEARRDRTEGINFSWVQTLR